MEIENGQLLHLPSLRLWRLRRVLTQSALAEASGVSRAAIVNMESGRRARYHVAQRLAKALRVSVEKLSQTEAERVEVA